MNDFKITIDLFQFEFQNITNLINILEKHPYIFPDEMHLFECKGIVIVPQTHGRLPLHIPIKSRDLLLKFNTSGIVDNPNVYYTIILKFNLVQPIAGTQHLKIKFHFLEDKTFFGYELPNAFPGTLLTNLNLEFRIFNNSIN